MIGLFRIVLIMLIVFLIQRAFSGNNSSDRRDEPGTGVKNQQREKNAKKSKELGEYVDYEEVDKRN
jgi:hypothetical protein